jgi:hypothetical protein
MSIMATGNLHLDPSVLPDTRTYNSGHWGGKEEKKNCALWSGMRQFVARI